MEALNSQATLFASGDHFDKDTIGKKAVAVKERYEKLKAPLTARKQKLTEAQSLQQFLRDVEDEEDWIREKEPIAASTNRGECEGRCALVKGGSVRVSIMRGRRGLWGKGAEPSAVPAGRGGLDQGERAHHCLYQQR